MGPVWGIAVVGMTAVLLVVFIRRLKTTGQGSGKLIATGVVIGLAVAGIGLLASRLS
jgi:DMSO reductase anchor subunit